MSRLQKYIDKLMGRYVIHLTGNKKVNLKPKVKTTNLKSNGMPIVEYKFTGRFTLEDIKEQAQLFSNNVATINKDLQVMVTLLYDDGWKSGYFRKAGEPVSVAEEYETDQKYFYDYRIYVKRSPSKKGGSGKYNDCLYYCFKKTLYYLNPFDKPSQLKKMLGLKRSEKIDIAHLPKIEDYMKYYKINVKGDHCYTSTKKGIMSINLILKNGHYEIDHSVNRKCKQDTKRKYAIDAFRNYHEKKLIVKNRDDNEIYDGKTLYNITKEEFDKMIDSKEYIFIPQKCQENKTKQETFDEFVKEAEIIKKESYGLINLFKNPKSLTQAYDLFDFFTKHVEDPDEIEQDEANLIDLASISAIQDCQKGYKGPGWKYDIVSLYPSIMTDSHFLVPMKRGEFKKLTADEFNKMPFYQYGIYRCKISHNGKCGNAKYFKFNDDNHYTHIDLNIAKERKLDIKIIEDENANALIYSRDKLINAHYLFKSFVSFMFDLKQKKVPKAKEILNILWGGLSRKVIFKKEAKPDNVVDVFSDRTITSIIPTFHGHKVKFFRNECMYKTSFARICPFLIAKGRETITKYIGTDIDIVVRVQTDGIITTKPLPESKIGTEMGELKFEESSQKIEIHNVNRIDGFTKKIGK
jgi:hypothetical protein